MGDVNYKKNAYLEFYSHASNYLPTLWRIVSYKHNAIKVNIRHTKRIFFDHLQHWYHFRLLSR